MFMKMLKQNGNAIIRIELCALDLQTGQIRKVSTVGVDDTGITEPPMIFLPFTFF